MIIRTIKNSLQTAAAKNWEKTYWAFDIHGTILHPTYQTGVVSSEFYPDAVEVLQIISRREDIVRILYTCSFPHEILTYLEYFKKHGIRFDHVNENPAICTGAYGHYERKFYFNILFEDKAGFDPMKDWTAVLGFLRKLGWT